MAAITPINKGFMKNLLRILVLSVAALSSCSRDYIGAPPSPDSQDKIEMTFQLKDDAGNVSYAADGTFDEDAFRDDLWMLAFTNNSGTLRYYGAYQVEVLDAGSPNGRITIPRGLLATSFRMLFVANSSEAWSAAGSPDGLFLENQEPRVGKTIDQVRNLLSLKVPTTGWRKNKTRLPMFAMLDHTVASSPLPTGPTYDYRNTVVLLRSVTRLDVRAQKTEADGSAKPLENFKIANVYVFNTSDHIWVPFDPEQVTFDPAKDPKYTVTAPSFPNGTPYDAPYDKYVTAIDQPESPSPTSPETLYSDISGLLYLPETLNVGQSERDEHLSRPYIIIKGYYGAEAIAKAEKGEKVRESYYRLEIADGQSGSTPNYMDLHRSDRIVLTINDVKSAGFDNIDDAKRNAGLNIDVSVSVFSQIPSNVVFNGQSYLAADRLSVTMPRDKGAIYKMAVSHSKDIPWGVWELGYKSDPADQTSASDLFLDKSSNTIVLPYGSTADNGRFEVTKMENRLQIKTLREWSADASDSLLLRAANLTLRMKISQENIDILDWEFGGNEDGEIVSDNELSQSSLYFPALGNSQRIRNYSARRDINTIEVYDSEGKKDPTWITYTLSSDKKTITIAASPNGHDYERTATMKVVLTGSGAGDKQYDITLTQAMLPTDNVLAASLGLRARDRNVGADGASYQYASTGTIYTRAQFNDNLCPEGWFTPEITDIQAYFRHPDISLLTITEEDGKDYALVMGTNHRAYLGPVDKTNATNNPWFWTYMNGTPLLYSYEYVANPDPSDQDVVNNMRLRINTSPSVGDQGFVRCVKGFRTRSTSVEINMIGEEGYLEFDPLNSTDAVKTINQPSNSRFKIERDGQLNRFRVTSSQTNWTTSPISETVTLAMDDGSTRTQTVTVTQAARLPFAGLTETITIDGIEWASVNAGVTTDPTSYANGVASAPYRPYAADPDAETGAAKYTKTYWVNGESGANNRITFYPAESMSWIRATDTGLTIGATDASGNEQNVSGDLGSRRNTVLTDLDPLSGKVYAGSAPNAICPSGWRPANVVEWASLTKHMRVTEVPLSGNSGQKVLVYYATDGKKVIFFPTGPAGRYQETDWRGMSYGTSTPYLINGVENAQWTYLLFFETSPDHVAAGNANLSPYGYSKVASPNDEDFDLLQWQALSGNYLDPENGSLLPSYLNISTNNLANVTAQCFYTRCVRESSAANR